MTDPNPTQRDREAAESLCAALGLPKVSIDGVARSFARHRHSREREGVMKRAVNNYEVIGKAIVEHGDGHVQHSLKLLYRGDSTPWWTCSSNLELPVYEAFFEATKHGDRITLTLSIGARP